MTARISMLFFDICVYFISARYEPGELCTRIQYFVNPSAARSSSFMFALALLIEFVCVRA